MNYEAKRLKAIEMIERAKKMGSLHEAAVIYNTLERANSVAFIDTRHANGILDRLLKSEFCMYLVEVGDT
jgi:hypothetical protein